MKCFKKTGSNKSKQEHSIINRSHCCSAWPNVLFLVPFKYFAWTIWASIGVTCSSSGYSFKCTIGVSYIHYVCTHNSPLPNIITGHLYCSVGLSASRSRTKWPHQVCHSSTAEWRQCTPERFRGQKLSHDCHSKSSQVWKLLHA